jgi:hypothetical protein
VQETQPIALHDSPTRKLGAYGLKLAFRSTVSDRIATQEPGRDVDIKWVLDPGIILQHVMKNRNFRVWVSTLFVDKNTEVVT